MIRQKAFQSNHLKYLFIFKIAIKEPPNLKKKYWEAKFRGCFSQVQQVKVVNKKLKDLHALATTILYQRFGLVCEGNPSFESCVEGKS